MGPGQGQHGLGLQRIPHRYWAWWRGVWGSGEWEWTVPQRGSCGSSGRISHPSLIGPERKEMWIMQWDVILEGWSMGHWRGSGYGKGLGWEYSPHLSLFCLPWVLLPWWQHLRMEETQGPWGGGDSSRLPYLWSGHQSQKSRDMPQEAEYAYSTKLKRKKKKKKTIP